MKRNDRFMTERWGEERLLNFEENITYFSTIVFVNFIWSSETCVILSIDVNKLPDDYELHKVYYYAAHFVTCINSFNISPTVQAINGGSFDFVFESSVLDFTLRIGYT